VTNFLVHHCRKLPQWVPSPTVLRLSHAAAKQPCISTKPCNHSKFNNLHTSYCGWTRTNDNKCEQITLTYLLLVFLLSRKWIELCPRLFSLLHFAVQVWGIVAQLLHTPENSERSYTVQPHIYLFTASYTHTTGNRSLCLRNHKICHSFTSGELSQKSASDNWLCVGEIIIIIIIEWITPPGV